MRAPAGTQGDEHPVSTAGGGNGHVQTDAAACNTVAFGLARKGEYMKIRKGQQEVIAPRPQRYAQWRRKVK